MRRSQIIMGTGASLDIPGYHSEKIFSDVFKLLRKIDGRFSTYKSHSELSKYRRGEIAESGLSAEMKEVKAACEKFEKLTGGYFSANFSGKFDPTGYVKGWAIAEAGRLVEKNGCKTFCIAIGGDILAGSDGKREWSIGIQDPADSSKILNKLSIYSGAVATSGSYERGAHIINPKTAKPANDFLSVSVTGPDIISADVLATAVFAAGQKAAGFIKNWPGYQILTVAGEVVGFNIDQINAQVQKTAAD